MISLLKKETKTQSYLYMGRLQWAVFLLFLVSFKAIACIPQPLEIDFDKIKKIVIVEAMGYRPIVLKTTADITFSKTKNFDTEKVHKNTFFGMNGKKGYYLNVKKEGEYNIEASDGDKKIKIRLVVKPEVRPAFGGSIPRGKTESIPKGLSNSVESIGEKPQVVESKGGCGGPSKIKYD
jgi:hypothetical protein